MAKTKTAYTQFKELAREYQTYSDLAQRVQKNEVVPGIHGVVADILKKKGVEDIAKDLHNLTESPNNHGLLGLMQEGVVLSKSEYDAFGDANLVSIVNSPDLGIDKVARVLLLLPPEADVAGHKSLSEKHKEASEFYRDLYLYQRDGNLSDEQKTRIVHDMKVRVLNEYQERFKDDESFFNRLVSFIHGYDNIAIAQYKRTTDAKVKDFTDALKASNSGKYVKAMALSDKKKDAFYSAIVSDN